MDAFSNFKGQVFDRRYKIIDKVGQGGMAVVFAATDVETGQKVAIKMLKETAAMDVKTLKRFINESRAIAMFDHNNIVKVYDISVDGPYKYIVMEYIEGMSLKDYLAYKKPIDWQDACIYCEQVLSALQHAHDRHVIHRDIKPANIMLMEGGYVKVADFGIAKILDGRTSTLTANTAIGTVYYISPEQAQNKKIDNRCDLYSVGCMLYEMVTGKLPFVADTALNVIMKQVQEEPVHPSKYNPRIPFGLEQIILKAMQKNPDDRYSSASEMSAALRLIRRDPTHLFVERKETAAPRTIEAKPAEKKASYYINDGESHPAEVHHASGSAPSAYHSGQQVQSVQHHSSAAAAHVPNAPQKSVNSTKNAPATRISAWKIILVFMIFFVVSFALIYLCVRLFAGADMKLPLEEGMMQMKNILPDCFHTVL